MDKFEKKIRKVVKNPENAVVVGSGFGNLASILSVHNTVFLFDAQDKNLKLKNLIYRETYEYLEFVSDVRVMYFDLSAIHRLESLKICWLRNSSLVLVEGNTIIERDVSYPLYDSGWRCTRVDKKFHVWEKYK